MFLEILASLIVGVFFGILTGLIPALHVNTIVALLFSFFIIEGSRMMLFISVFIIAMAITHTLFDTFPSIFLGVVDETSFISQLPGQEYVKRGKGEEAYLITLLGSLIAIFLSILLLLPLSKLYEILESELQNIVLVLLLLTLIIIILKEDKKSLAIIVAILAASIGEISFNMNVKNSLFVMLTGFFTVPTLIESIKSKAKIPKQERINAIKLKINLWKESIKNQCLGIISSIVPGFSVSQALVVSKIFSESKDEKESFLFGNGLLTTTNFFLSILTFYVLNKARNGAIVAISQLSQELNIYIILLFFASAISAAGIASILAVSTIRKIISFLGKVDYVKLNKILIIFILMLLVMLTNLEGYIIFIISSILGEITLKLKVSRNVLMTSIMIPVIIFYLQNLSIL